MQYLHHSILIPQILSGLNIERRILDKILYEVDSSGVPQ
jgi:hypothetical protein